MRPVLPTDHLVRDEMEILAGLVPLGRLRQVVELGCGKAEFARRLVAQWPDLHLSALEVDARQMAANRAMPAGTWERITLIEAGAQAIPLPAASIDLALMLKSLHHVPPDLLDQSLAEVARVLRPGGWFYVSEPVYDGLANEVIRLFNDEGEVRRAAYAALQRALSNGPWVVVAERFFEMPTRYRDFADFERRMVDVTFAQRCLTGELREEVRRRFERLAGHAPDGSRTFTRPMRVNLLQRA